MGNLSSKRAEAHTTLTGLYEHCEWDGKVVRRLILEKKLAPISVGREEATVDGLEECPICFLYYAGGLNRSRCCRKGACTECYLQVKRPNQNTTCPFCNHAQYIVTFSGPLSKEEVAQEAQEQLKVLELKINMRKEEIERDKQREQEKERLRKENELNGNVTSSTTSTTQLNPNANFSPVPPPPPSSSLHGQHHSTSVSAAQQFTFHEDTIPPVADPDLDELMLMEAIRLSLLDVHSSLKDESPISSTTTTRNAPPSSTNDYNSDSDEEEVESPEGGQSLNSNLDTTTPSTPIARLTPITPMTPTSTTTTTTTTTSTSMIPELSTDIIPEWAPFSTTTTTTTTSTSATPLSNPIDTANIDTPTHCANTNASAPADNGITSANSDNSNVSAHSDNSNTSAHSAHADADIVDSPDTNSTKLDSLT